MDKTRLDTNCYFSNYQTSIFLSIPKQVDKNIPPSLFRDCNNHYRIRIIRQFFQCRKFFIFCRFMAFHPKACSAQGEYGMIIDAGEVMTWLEENPEAAENEKLSALKELTDDSNPVVIITVPK